ncbi:DcuS/MalK family sensor histidine kinase [Salibacterium aidingense]|uniref:DcuS/MalK family sensor histidine kinase n=1 Tax=Salibacterium aidingense TaxID=384933 RepID=UPI003BDEC1ED
MKRWLNNRRPIRLQSWITLLVSFVTLVALLVTGVLIARDTAEQAREAQKEKTMDVAHAVAFSDIVRNGLQEEFQDGEIQAYTKQVQDETDVAYIVVMNMDHIRQSHPVEERIGQYFVGNDEDRAFEGESYSSVAEGTLGESLRSFVPITNEEGRQIGVVSVGILLDNIESVMMDRQKIVYLGSGAGMLIGVLGALWLARRIKYTMHGLEPREIGQLLQEREAMLASVREGIIAINDKGYIIIVNDAARALFQRAGIRKDPMGERVDVFFPESRLREILSHQHAEYDQEMSLNDLSIIVNRMPVALEEKVVGAIATFREKTELTTLLEQLTGARHYAERLRAQTHEFMNKLHVISAMVHTESYQELEEYISQISTAYQRDTGSVSKLVKDPVLAGYLLNKFNTFQEQDIEIELEGGSPLPVLRKTEQMDGLITVIGNLMDNAMEAVQNQARRHIKITIHYMDDVLYFAIRDNGRGMTEEEMENIYQSGISAKGRNRGYGMELTRKALQEMNGDIEIFSEKGTGTRIEVTVPYEGDHV